jgi:AcrR family transcriptional regulator
MPQQTTRSVSSADESGMNGRSEDRILAAALDLYSTRGYVATSVTAIAKAAGVSPQEVYTTYGNKGTLLSRLVERLLNDGANHDVARAAAAIIGEPDPVRMIANLASYVRGTHERTAALVDIVQIASRTEPHIADVRRRMEEFRHGNLTVLAQLVIARSGRMARSNPAAAADTLWALTSNEVYTLMTAGRGYSPDAYEAWLRTVLSATLLPNAAAT